MTDITNISGGRPTSFRSDRINTTVQPRWTSIHILQITFSLGSNCSMSPQRFAQSRLPPTIIGGLGTGFWGSHCAKRKSLHCKSGCQTYVKKSITCSLYTVRVKKKFPNWFRSVPFTFRSFLKRRSLSVGIPFRSVLFRLVSFSHGRPRAGHYSRKAAV